MLPELEEVGDTITARREPGSTSNQMRDSSSAARMSRGNTASQEVRPDSPSAGQLRRVRLPSPRGVASSSPAVAIFALFAHPGVLQLQSDVDASPPFWGALRRDTRPRIGFGLSGRARSDAPWEEAAAAQGREEKVLGPPWGVGSPRVRLVSALQPRGFTPLTRGSPYRETRAQSVPDDPCPNDSLRAGRTALSSSPGKGG